MNPHKRVVRLVRRIHLPGQSIRKAVQEGLVSHDSYSKRDNSVCSRVVQRIRVTGAMYQHGLCPLYELYDAFLTFEDVKQLYSPSHKYTRRHCSIHSSELCIQHKMVLSIRLNIIMKSLQILQSFCQPVLIFLYIKNMFVDKHFNIDLFT